MIGTFFKVLTSGKFNVSIINALAEIILEDEDLDPEFIQNIVTTWQKDELDEPSQGMMEKMPVVSPLNTFGESNFIMPGGREIE